MDSSALDPRLRIPDAPHAHSAHAAHVYDVPPSSLTAAGTATGVPRPPSAGAGASASAAGAADDRRGSFHGGSSIHNNNHNNNNNSNNAPAAASSSTPSSASSPDISRGGHGLPPATTYPNPNFQQDLQTPPSAAFDPNDDVTPGGPDNENGGPDAKKPRACEACRGLKVRCEPDPNNPDGACKRCAKAGRNCIVTQPTRKRQKKTDSRVAELEKKIDALTASLTATKAAQAGHPIPGMPDGAGGIIYGGGMDASRGWSTVNAAMQRETPSLARSQNQSPYAEGGSMAYAPPMVLAGQKRKYTETRESVDDAPTPSVAPSAFDTRSHEYSDIVDRGIITAERASILFDRYNYQMAPHLPAVVFPREMTVGELRKTKPILFLAVMSAASSEFPNVQRVIVKELMQVFADKIMMTGEKSVELVQALNISVVWYWPPEHFEELKFYELVHMAAIMAIDLGLGKRKSRRGKQTGPTWRDHPFRKHPPPDPTTIEARRTWLMCYFLTTNTAMALHRPFLLRWTSFMSECLDVLESSPEAAPTDKYFCHLVRTHQLAEEIGFQFCMDDSTIAINLADYMTQHKVRGFERELEKHRQEVARELMQPSLKFSFHTINLYMHELALQNEPADAFKAPFAAETLRDSLINTAALTPAYTNALAACLTAIDGIFETFFSMHPSSIRCLPVFNFVRVAYATVVLIRIYFAACAPNSELGKIIDKDSMKVDQHLDNLLDKFREVAADDKSRPAAKFLVVLVMIRSWFHKINKGELNQSARIADAANAAEGTSPFATPDAARGAAGGEKRTPTGSASTPGYSAQMNSGSSTSNTNPLQLLSEAATNNQAAASTAQAARGHAGGSGSLPSNAWYGQMSSFPSSDAGNAAAAAAVAAAVGQQHNKPNGGAGSGNGNGNGRASGTDGTMAPPPQPYQHGQVTGIPAPWMNFGGPGEQDYSNLGDGFAQAWDTTLQGLNDGNGGLQDFNGLSIMASDPLFGQMLGDFPASDFFQF